MKIISVVAARPNFIKVAPLIRTIEDYNNTLSDETPLSSNVPHAKGNESLILRTEGVNLKPETSNPEQINHLLVHTGQHYDDRMSKSFFEALGIPNPDINLKIGSGTHAEQVGNTMIAFEKVLMEENPDWVVVIGDVNATLACSVTAKKLNIKVCHIEAGLRSGDTAMPEEVNRLVTDHLSDLLLTSDKLSTENLRKEGVPEKKIKFVGNIMIDTLEENRERAEHLSIDDILKNNLIPDQISSSFSSSSYALITMHRPSNVDTKQILERILNFLADEVATDMPVIWPIHPRTQKMLQKFELWKKAITCKKLILLHPIGYHEMLRLNMSASIMLTDSGGLQEECCVLGTPCLILRWNTERPVTLKEHGGACVLVGNDINRIREEYYKALKAGRIPQRPKLWDGNTVMRCVEAIVNYYGPLGDPDFPVQSHYDFSHGMTILPGRYF